MNFIQQTIESAFETRQSITPTNASLALKDAIAQVFQALNDGSIRVAEKINGEWQVHSWIKKAILLSFRVQENKVMDAGVTRFFDKVELKYPEYQQSQFETDGVRVVPGAVVRQGSYIAPQTILMPSFVNVGAFIDTGCMIDTWATVGSCAQIGKNVHLSGGAGIGGVLEPLQANPVIIEDNCFIGARSEIVEGVIVGEGSVISMGVFIGQSTRIYNRMTDEITYGVIPPGSVIVPGSLPGNNGKYHLNCAVIVKQVDAKTRAQVGLNELLREATAEC